MRQGLGRSAALGLLAVLAGSLGCGPAATYRLPPSSGNPDLRAGELLVTATADTHNVPSQGWDLALELGLEWRGQERSRLDLARSLVRVNGLSWNPCRPPDDVDRNALLVVLEPGATTTTTLHCMDIPKPDQGLEVRLYATGTGAPGGYIDLAFRGVN